MTRQAAPALALALGTRPVPAQRPLLHSPRLPLIPPPALTPLSPDPPPSQARKYKKAKALRRAASTASNMSKASEKTVSDRLDTTGGLTHLPSIPPAYECPHPHDAVGDVESIDSEEAEHEKHKYDRNHLPWIQVRTAGAAVARGSMQLVWGRQTVAGWAGAATAAAPAAGLPSSQAGGMPCSPPC